MILLVTVLTASHANSRPVVFEPNRGQSDPATEFVGRTESFDFRLAGDQLALTPLDSCGLDEPVIISFNGGNATPPAVGVNALPSISNYFFGNDPSAWITSVPHFSRVRLLNVYEGIDVAVHGEGGALEYDFEVAAGADPGPIVIAISSVVDACHEPDGGLQLRTPSGAVELGPLRVSQGSSFASAHYVVNEGPSLTVRIEVDTYDPNAPLIIDPTILWSSYLGGTDSDLPRGLAIDAFGNAYSTGGTFSLMFPIKNPYQATNLHPGTEVCYITKIDATGQLVYSTYLGGSVAETSFGVDTDSQGNAYIAGVTSSPDFPVKNPIMAFQGQGDAFVTKFSPDGSTIEYSTFLGGSRTERATGIAVRGFETFVTGNTDSPDFPIANPYQSSFRGGATDGFVAKLDATGTSLAYSTYVGGSDEDHVNRIAVDSLGQASLTGYTQSADYPIKQAFQSNLRPPRDVFVTKLSSTGAGLVFSTYLGGVSLEDAPGVCADSNGRTWVGGATTSPDFPVLNAYQPIMDGPGDGFVSCFDAAGSLVYSTFFGGSADEDVWAVAASPSGTIVFGGSTRSDDLPILDAFQSFRSGQKDSYVGVFDASGRLVMSSYLGGSDEDWLSNLDVTSADTIVAMGFTRSPDFPTVNPFQANYAGDYDAYLARIARCNPIVVSPVALPAGTRGVPYSQTFTATGGTPPYTYAISTGAIPPGLLLSASGVISGTPTTTGNFGFTLTARDNLMCAGSAFYVLTIGGSSLPEDLLAGQGLGPTNPNRVRVFVSNGTATTTDFLAYSAGSWGVNAAAANLQGAANDQILTGPGPGATLGPQARAFDRDGNPVQKINYYAFGTLKYGLNLVGVDFDGDSFGEILTGAGPGAVFGPHVRGWNYDNAAISSVGKISFFAYGTLKYGCNVGSANLDADSFGELLTGAGPGVVFASNARAWNFDASSVTAIAKVNFIAFTYTGYGVNVAGGDVDGDGFDEIGCTPGPGATHPARFLGFDYDGSSLTALPGFDITLWTGYGGRVGIGDLSGDQSADLVAGLGRDPAADSRAYPFLYSGGALVPLLVIDPFPGALYGLNATSAALGF